MIIDEGTRVTEVTVITVFDDTVRHQEVIHEGYTNTTRTIVALMRVAEVFTITLSDGDIDEIDPDIYMLFEIVQAELRILGMQLDMKVHEITLDTVDWE